MKTSEVQVGATYTAKVSGAIKKVRVLELVTRGSRTGVKVLSLKTNRELILKSAMRLRKLIEAAPIVAAVAAEKTVDDDVELDGETHSVPESNRGFTHYPVQWDKDNLRFGTTVAGIRFYGEYRKTDTTGQCVVDVRCKRGSEHHVLDSIVYDVDPRSDIKSLNSDLCACITMWLHNHPFPGSTCAHCGSPDHQSKNADNKCTLYLKSLIRQQIVVIHRLETLDNLIMRLTEFRHTAVRCGGQRGFDISGDTPASAKVFLQVDLTRQAILLDGKVPSIRGGGGAAIDGVGDSMPQKKGRGQRALPAERMSTGVPLAENVTALAQQLAKSTDPSEKRKIRAAMRRMGHVGGGRAVGGAE